MVVEVTAEQSVPRSVQIGQLIDLIYATGLNPNVSPVLVDAMLQDLSAVVRPGGHEGLTENQSQTALDIAGHLSQALALNRYLGEQTNPAHSTEPMLSTLGFPLLVIESSLRVLYVGDHGSQFLQNRSEIRFEGRQLTVIDAHLQLYLDRIFTNALPGDPAEREIFRDKRDGMWVYAMPLPLADGTLLCLLAWFDAAQQAERHGTELAGVYSLTRAEGDLLDGLMSDASYAALATERGVTENTVRSQVKQIFAKTDCHSRSGLVQKVLCGPELLRRLVSSRSGKFNAGSTGKPRHHQQVRHASGRHIGFSEYGTAAGTPVMLMHDVVGSRPQLPVPESHLLEQGIRLIMPDRPGVGLSDPVEDPSMDYWVEGIEHLLDHLGLQKALLMGGSIGGVYALAAAAMLPTRFERLSLVNTMTEMLEEDLNEMDVDLRKIIRLARLLPPVIARLVLQLVMRDQPWNQVDPRITKLSELGTTMNRGTSIHELTVGALPGTLRHGGTMMIDDFLMLTRPWEFRLEDVVVPVQCWHMSLDAASVPVTVERLVRRLQHCRLRMVSRETPTQVYPQWDTCLACLVKPELFGPTLPMDDPIPDGVRHSFPVNPAGSTPGG